MRAASWARCFAVLHLLSVIFGIVPFFPNGRTAALVKFANLKSAIEVWRPDSRSNQQDVCARVRVFPEIYSF